MLLDNLVDLLMAHNGLLKWTVQTPASIYWLHLLRVLYTASKADTTKKATSNQIPFRFWSSTSTISRFVLTLFDSVRLIKRQLC